MTNINLSCHSLHLDSRDSCKCDRKRGLVSSMTEHVRRMNDVRINHSISDLSWSIQMKPVRTGRNWVNSVSWWTIERREVRWSGSGSRTVWHHIYEQIMCPNWVGQSGVVYNSRPQAHDTRAISRTHARTTTTTTEAHIQYNTHATFYLGAYFT